VSLIILKRIRVQQNGLQEKIVITPGMVRWKSIKALIIDEGELIYFIYVHVFIYCHCVNMINNYI